MSGVLERKGQRSASKWKHASSVIFFFGITEIKCLCRVFHQSSGLKRRAETGLEKWSEKREGPCLKDVFDSLFLKKLSQKKVPHVEPHVVSPLFCCQRRGLMEVESEDLYLYDSTLWVNMQVLHTPDLISWLDSQLQEKKEKREREIEKMNSG